MISMARLVPVDLTCRWPLFLTDPSECRQKRQERNRWYLLPTPQSTPTFPQLNSSSHFEAKKTNYPHRQPRSPLSEGLGKGVFPRILTGFRGCLYFPVRNQSD